MSIKRHTGAAFSEVSTRERWNGSSWVALTFGKRWNGSAWVDLWSNSSSSSGSSGGSGGSSGTTTSGSGSISKVSSTVSRPTVNYSGSFTWSKSGSSLTVPVKFAAWISSSAKLGSGVKLTVYARLNGGAWMSAVIKNTSAVWSNSSAKHYAAVNLNGTAKSTNTIEWYVTRSGSTYSGTAGNFGSSSSPKKKTFS